MWKGAIVLVSVLAVSAAYLARAQLEAKPEKFKNQEGCYFAEFDKVVPFGSSTPSTKKCEEYRCNEQSVTIAGCGVVVAKPPARVVQDKSKPYPECCKKIVTGPEKQ